MFSFLKNHPFAVEAFFESSLVATFAAPKENIRHLIPGCVELDTFNDKWAFIAVAMVQTKDLRPRGFPRVLGSDFFLVGYRVFVRFTDSSGRSLRGLYILRSETNKRRMELLGNIFTHYKYTTIDIDLQKQDGSATINSHTAGFSISFEEPNDDEQVALPADSPFADWKQARKFAGPLPFTFTYDDKNKTVLIVEGVRQNWTPVPVNVTNYRFPFLNELGTGFILANAFLLRDVPYYWKKGRVENWQK
jgi:hypothetical protein